MATTDKLNPIKICKNCVSYELCQYNAYQEAKYCGKDKEELITINNKIASHCKFFKHNTLSFIIPRCENCSYPINDLKTEYYEKYMKFYIASHFTPAYCPNCKMRIDRLEIDIDKETCIARGDKND